jgi:hypothetical protein
MKRKVDDERKFEYYYVKMGEIESGKTLVSEITGSKADRVERLKMEVGIKWLNGNGMRKRDEARLRLGFLVCAAMGWKVLGCRSEGFFGGRSWISDDFGNNYDGKFREEVKMGEKVTDEQKMVAGLQWLGKIVIVVKDGEKNLQHVWSASVALADIGLACTERGYDGKRSLVSGIGLRKQGCGNGRRMKHDGSTLGRNEVWKVSGMDDRSGGLKRCWMMRMITVEWKGTTPGPGWCKGIMAKDEKGCYKYKLFSGPMFWVVKLVNCLEVEDELAEGTCGGPGGIGKTGNEL